VPFGAAWMGENGFAAIPTAAYGVVLLMSGVAFLLLVRALIAHGDEHAGIADAIGRDAKGKISLAVYVLAIPIALVWPLVAFAIYIAVALVWFVPDRRISSRLGG
jgi:TMEM175 potassium channel family protein